MVSNTVKLPANAEKTTLQRYERKFVVPGVSSHRVRTAVRLHPALFREMYEPRWVNNIYFDTPGLENFHANVVGADQRRKARLRWYGELTGEISPVFEVKLKIGLAGHKVSCPVGKMILQGPADIQRIHDELLRNPDVLNLDHDFSLYNPSLINRYFRRYFLSADRKFRLTIDEEMQYIRPLSAGWLERVVDVDSIIVELKYEVSDDEHADTIAGEFPFRVTKSSKYVRGIDLINQIQV